MFCVDSEMVSRTWKYSFSVVLCKPHFLMLVTEVRIQSPQRVTWIFLWAITWLLCVVTVKICGISWVPASPHIHTHGQGPVLTFLPTQAGHFGSCGAGRGEGEAAALLSRGDWTAEVSVRGAAGAAGHTVKGTGVKSDLFHCYPFSPAK